MTSFFSRVAPNVAARRVLLGVAAPALALSLAPNAHAATGAPTAPTSPTVTKTASSTSTTLAASVSAPTTTKTSTSVKTSMTLTSRTTTTAAPKTTQLSSAQTTVSVPHVVIGIPAPSDPNKITNDDQAVAWALKNSTPAELTTMAEGMGVRMPADAYFGTPQCLHGDGTAPVWVINFTTKDVNWNVLMDGKLYATATSLPKSHGYAALTVPAGKHTLMLVNPVTGKTSDTLNTNFACAPVSSPVKKPVTKPLPVKPAATKPTVKKAAKTTVAPTVTKKVVKQAAPAPRVSVKTGPAIQTDYVPAQAAQGSLSLANTGVGLLALGGLAYLLALSRRVRN